MVTRKKILKSIVMDSYLGHALITKLLFGYKVNIHTINIKSVQIVGMRYNKYLIPTLTIIYAFKF